MIIGSFALSVFAFSIILKASTVLIDIHPTFWKGITASILIGFGITTLFPNLWEWFTMKCGLQTKSDALLRQSQQKKGIVADILVGAALGPVFSSCSPTYSLILATIFPVSFGQGAIYLLAYIGGLVCMLFLVARFG
jgi:sulfite exporter TauE/SafE